MKGELLNGLNEWIVALILLVLLMVGAELGFRTGAKIQSRLSEAVITQVGTMCAAIIGLLALLLAFTFAMALSRNDLRRELVVDEADAIGALYLRADLLPEPERTQIKELAREYVQARLDFYNAEDDAAKLDQANKESVQLQNRLWAFVPLVVQKDDRTATAGLFIEALNKVIDFHTKRLSAMENKVPTGIFYLLFVVSLMATVAVGYGSGIGKNRHPLPTVMLCLIVVFVIAVIVDLDRPRRGFIRISQDSMERLQNAVRIRTL
jgi:hypothetical protein